MTNRVEQLLKLLEASRLTPAEYLEISKAAGRRAREDNPAFRVAGRERMLETGRVCAFCGTAGAQRHGRDARGNQRYRCLSKSRGGCGRTFTALTGTPVSGMKRRDQWDAFLTAMAAASRSIDALHRSGEVQVSRLTLARWRRRLQQAIKSGEMAPMPGVPEIDEEIVRDSFKGSRGWVRGAPPADRPPYRRGGDRKRRASKA